VEDAMTFSNIHRLPKERFIVTCSQNGNHLFLQQKFASAVDAL